MTSSFGGQSVFAPVRNLYSFHYSPAEIKDVFKSISEEHGWEIYLSKTETNSLYYVTENILDYALLNTIKPNDEEVALLLLMNDCITLHKHFTRFAATCLAVLTEAHLLDPDGKIEFKKLEIECSAKINDMRLPFFLDTDTLEEAIRLRKMGVVSSAFNNLALPPMTPGFTTGFIISDELSTD